MDLLKRIFSGDKLSNYEKEQKRRYKRYVKLGTTNTIVMSKSESEIYQDYLIRKSLRRSKRKASAVKAQREEDIFKETNTNPGLSAAPAVLDAVNRNVSITNVPNDFLDDLNQMETFTTVQTHIPNSVSKPERRRSSHSERNDTAFNAPAKSTQPLDEKFAYGNQDKFLDQLDEVIRSRNKGQPRGSDASTPSPTPLYENTKHLEEQYSHVPIAKPRKKIEENPTKENRNTENVESYIPKQLEQMNELSTITHTIHMPMGNEENSADFYQNENMDEIMWGTPPSNNLPASRSNSCITTQSEDSFFDCISEDDDIYDDEEKKVMKQISPPFRERKESYNGHETDFRSLGSEDGLEQDSLQPPRYDSVMKEEKRNEQQKIKDTLIDSESTDNKPITSNNVSENFIEPDSLETQIEPTKPVNNLASKQKESERNPERNLEPEIEPESEPEVKERNINNMTSWMERVRMKERDFVSNEFSKEKVREHEEAQIQDEALLLETHYNNFKDDPEFLNISESHRAIKNHLIKLENNNDYSDISIESDRGDGKKVTFDFAKSYCQTYEVDNSVDDCEEDDSSLSIRIGENRVLRPIDEELYLENHYQRPSKMKRHNLENLHMPTDDRTRVFLSYGVQPTPTPEEEMINKIFENSINMDLAFLNCVDGFEIELPQPKPKSSVKIVELDDEGDIKNQTSQINDKLETHQSGETSKIKTAPTETVEPDINENSKRSLLQHNRLINIENSDTARIFDNAEIENGLFIEPPPSFATTDAVELIKESKQANEDSASNLPRNTPNVILVKPDAIPQDIYENHNIHRFGSSCNSTHEEIMEQSQPIHKINTIRNWQSPFLNDIGTNRYSGRVIDGSLSPSYENDNVLELQRFSNEIDQNSSIDRNVIYNEADSLIAEGNETEYYEVINPTIDTSQTDDRYHRRLHNQPLITYARNNEIDDETEHQILPKNLNPLTKSSIWGHNSYWKDDNRDKYKTIDVQTEAQLPENQSDIDADVKSHEEYNRHSKEGDGDKYQRIHIETEAQLPENHIAIEVNGEIHNGSKNDAPEPASSPEHQFTPEEKEESPRYSLNNSSKPTSNSLLNRSTSETALNKYRIKRHDIFSNRNVFTSNARKPLIRSTSHNFGYAFASPKVSERVAADENRLTRRPTSLSSDLREVEENATQSLSEIQRRLSEIRKMEAPEAQLAQMQDILVDLKQRADLLESRTDDEYVGLLQTLFKSIRITSGLQCNFDQGLLASQQKTLKDIKDCISYLNTK